MTGQQSRPGGRSQAAHESIAADDFIVSVCPVCGGTGRADDADVLGAAYRLTGRDPRRPRRRRLTEDRRRELANKMVNFGMPVDVATEIFRIAPRTVA